jgi:hypothetical protein
MNYCQTGGSRLNRLRRIQWNLATISDGTDSGYRRKAHPHSSLDWRAVRSDLSADRWLDTEVRSNAGRSAIRQHRLICISWLRHEIAVSFDEVMGLCGHARRVFYSLISLMVSKATLPNECRPSGWLWIFEAGANYCGNRLG